MKATWHSADLGLLKHWAKGSGRTAIGEQFLHKFHI
jgi:hypothetical protein